LAARLSRGPLPLDQALRCAIEIADALDKAHRHGIVHRDLKPGNIMLTKAGAKLLDFGVAKMNRSVISGAAVSGLTVTSPPVTARGTILGTFQYMAPEQLEGREADARSDIFAFGALLYETVTGRRAFEGKTPTTLISAIMTSDPPPITTVAPLAPAALDHVVRTCLAKDPDERFQSAHDVLVELRWIKEAGSQAGLPAPVSKRRRVREAIGWGIACAALLSTAALAAVHFRAAAPDVRPMRFQILTPDRLTAGSAFDLPGISPDGRRLAFTGALPGESNLLWIRPLENIPAKFIPGTEGAQSPFWSPDSRFIAFFVSGSRGQLKKVDASGGPVRQICELPAFGFGQGGTWNRDGTIVFGTSSGPLYAVPASGGEARAVTSLDRSRADQSHRAPQFLPDGRLLYLVQGGQKAGIYVTTLGSADARFVLSSTSAMRYVAPGYLLFGSQGTLMAQRFEPGTLQTDGEPFPIAEQVGQGLPGMTFSVSDTGVLAYSSQVVDKARLVWFRRDGTRLGNIGEPGPYRQIALSPDEKQVAVEQRLDPSAGDIWLLNLTSGIFERFTSAPSSEQDPVWSPDGRRIVFTSNRKGVMQLYWKVVGGNEEKVLFASPENTYGEHFYGHGQFLIYTDQNGRVFNSLPLTGEPKPTLLGGKTDFSRDEPHLSPDERWVAYGSNESGQWEIYIASFPSLGDKRQISTEGGRQARWRKDGRELYYLSPDGKVMAVEVRSGTTLATGPPRALFQSALLPSAILDQYSVTGDGQRFLIAEPLAEPAKPMTVVLNWTAELQQKRH
jgi:eukaryotic-like serine/threonine-protein kinase